MEKNVVNQSAIRKADPVSMLKQNAMLIVLVLVYIFFTIMTGGRMFRPNSFNSLINQNAYVFILGCGMLMCMLTGGNIDLSCGSVVCLLGALGATMMVMWGWGAGVSILLMLVVGLIYGCGLGAIIAYVRVPPWIATLAGYLAFRGLGTSILSVSVTNSISVKDNQAFLDIFSGTLFKTPEGEMNIPCIVVGIVAAALVVLVIFKNRATRLKKGYEVDELKMDVIKSVLGAAVIILVMYKLSLAGGIPTVLLWVAGVVLVYAFITSKTTSRAPLRREHQADHVHRLSEHGLPDQHCRDDNAGPLHSGQRRRRQELRNGRHFGLCRGRCFRQRRRRHRAGHGYRCDADRRHQPGHVPGQPGRELSACGQGLRASGRRGVRHPEQEKAKVKNDENPEEQKLLFRIFVFNCFLRHIMIYCFQIMHEKRISRLRTRPGAFQVPATFGREY